MDEFKEINIRFKPLQYKQKLNYDILGKKFNYKDFIVIYKSNNIYNYLESSYPPRILNIKLSFFSYIQKENQENDCCISLDSIILYENKDNNFKLLNDSEEFIFEADKENVIYYNFNENKINVRIDFFSCEIDHFNFNLSEMCSIFMLKYLIYLKLKNIEAMNNYKTIEINNGPNNNNQKDIISYKNTYSKYLIKIKDIEKTVKLYGNGIINKSYQGYNSKDETNRYFPNNSLLLNSLNYYLSFSRNNICSNSKDIKNNDLSSVNENENYNYNIEKTNEINININKNKISIYNNNSEYTISFIMTECKKDKLILGLDFRFNILNYFSPYYIEKDNKSEYLTNSKKFINKSKIILYNGGGLKLFLYCLNQKCIYFSKYFVHHLGYGYFDIFNAMRNICCPLCKKKGIKSVEIKYIGMMNAKWIYKGYLSGVKNSNVEGQGITILNDIIYRTNEILFSQQFISINFQIIKYFSNNTIINEEKHKKYCNTINSTYFTDNSYYSNISDEEQKNVNDEKNKNNEINKIIPIRLMKKKINRIEKKKFRNRNRINNFKQYTKISKYSNNISNNNSKSEINELLLTKNETCCENCINGDKNEDNCLIF